MRDYVIPALHALVETGSEELQWLMGLICLVNEEIVSREPAAASRRQFPEVLASWSSVAMRLTGSMRPQCPDEGG